jgi:hypothetical protein
MAKNLVIVESLQRRKRSRNFGSDFQVELRAYADLPSKEIVEIWF